MVHRCTEESVMDEPDFELVAEAMFRGELVTSIDLDHLLSDMGYMIVPIEDPTNLFGAMEDNGYE